MKYSKVLFVLILQALACSLISSQIIAGDIDTQELFKQHCIVCHGEDGKGKTDLGEGLGARDFTNEEFQDSITDEKIIDQIANGTPEKMFPFKDKLTPEEMKALVPVIRAFGG